ncbi:amidase [Phaeacidiphilus oryzae]|uniref:amidase n=1 Tax=Phaeacidiphilus oryzae TaxID=348818 RepID=UPI000A07476B|nr:amidase [Phaeacidiphilus oryzae]
MSSELHYTDATRLAGLIRSGEVSSREVVQAHLDRIAAHNETVNAVVTLDAEGALTAAGRADRAVRAGEALGPLHGLPVAVKDTHLTKGMRTTHGSRIYADHVPEEDELLVARMRAAGAIVIGKTNVPEFAAGSHTFNSVFGRTRNPYDRSRSAGGSSGGAAVSLACGFVPLADGSDMGGSLRNPASFNNVVGLRPTPGRVPAHPQTQLWETLGTAGPLARTVADVALLLSVLAGPDPRCPAALETPGETFRRPALLAGASEPGALSGLRIAWSPDLGQGLPVAPEVLAVLEPQLRVFEELGARVETAAPDLSEAEYAFRTLRAHTFADAMSELVERHRELFKPSLIWNVEEGLKLSGPEVGRARAALGRTHLRGVEFFSAYDLLLAPVSQVAPFDGELEYPREIRGTAMETYLDWMRSAYLVTAMGVPALSVPAGFTEGGLPVGIQIVAAPRREDRVLRAGAAYESATRHGERRPAF